jgi:hypothetical protein
MPAERGGGLMDWLTFVVVDPVKAMLVKVMSYIPAIIGAVVILVIGWLIAKLIEAVVIRILKAVRLDIASDKAGMAKILAQGEIRLTISEIIGVLVYWIIILMAITSALNALNLTIAADLMAKLVEYVPNILGAVFALIVGSILANFVATIVRTTASNAGIAKAKMLGQLTQVVLIVVAVVMAIEQLRIASTLIVLAVNVILISIGLGIAIAFGLGCKDLAGKFMSDVINNMKK